MTGMGCEGSKGLSINKALIHTWSVAGFASVQFLRGQRVCHVRRSVSNKNAVKVSGVMYTVVGCISGCRLACKC